MPTYQYRCTECGHAFEEFQSFTDDALTVCSMCGGRLRKVFNAVGVVFKGSGFYRNDSRSASSSGDSSGSAAPSESAGSSASSESSGSADSGSSTGSTSGSSGSDSSSSPSTAASSPSTAAAGS